MRKCYVNQKYAHVLNQTLPLLNLKPIGLCTTGPCGEPLGMLGAVSPSPLGISLALQ